MNQWKNLILFLSSFFCLLIFATPVNAQQASLLLEPASQEIIIKPGNSAFLNYTLKNLGDPTLVSLQLSSFEPLDQTGTVKIKKDIEGVIRFALIDQQFATPFFLKNGQSAKLTLQLRVPEGAKEGDYYYTFLAQSQAPPAIEGMNVSRAKITLGSHLLITVSKNGKIEVKPKITSFTTRGGWRIKFAGKTFNLFDSFDKIPLVLVVQNSGANLLKPRGKVELKGPFESKRSFLIPIQTILAFSQKQLAINNQLSNKSDFLFGQYTLIASLSFGQTTPAIFASYSFIVLPYKLMTAVLIILLTISAVFVRVKKSW